MGHSLKTWRLIAYIKELASLRCSVTGAARLLGVSANFVSILASKHNIAFDRMESPFRRAIRQGYADGKSPAEIAFETGHTASSVKVLASKMGLTAHTVRDPSKFRRGFQVPAEKMNEYKALRKLGMTFKECGYELGILTRPPTARLTAEPNVNSAHKFSQVA